MKDLCVVAFVSGEYEILAPMWRYCIEKEYPEYDVMIEHRLSCDGLPPDGLFTAALRFLEDIRDGHKYYLITDVDILIFREKWPILQEHLDRMNDNGLQCYSNCRPVKEEKRMQGVHFCTDKWFERTLEARRVWFEFLQKCPKLSKGFDEKMLYKIVIDSCLPEPPVASTFNSIHGIHLGAWRTQPKRRLNGDETLVWADLKKDERFMNLFGDAAKRLPYLRAFYNMTEG